MWTVRTAWLITPISAADAAGVASPSARRAPPPASEAPAVTALRLPGLRPIESKAPPVASRPWPPNQPNSFCAPWATNTAPSVARRAVNPSFMVMPPKLDVSIRLPGPRSGLTRAAARTKTSFLSRCGQMLTATVRRFPLMDYKLELIAVPVSDVDRAKAFYTEQAGFNADHDHRVSDELRFVQLTPPGSACSIAIGQGMMDAPPGSVRGLQLV